MLLATPKAWAFRCDGGIVSVGNTLVDTIFYDEWTYDLGPNRFIRLVVFENGRVTRVEHGGYGKKQ